MTITNVLSRIFDLNGIEFQYIDNLIPDEVQSAWTANSVTLSNLATITLLKTTDSIILAIFPISHHLNLAKLVKIYNKPVSFLNISEIQIFNEQSSQKSITEIMSINNIEVIFDIQVTDLIDVLFKNNSEKNYLSVTSLNLEKLILKNPLGCQFSDAKPEFVYQPDLTIGAPRLNLSSKINNIDALPIFPEIAGQILQLQNNANATVDSLADIVSQDPALTSLILKYANSALFGLRGSVESVYEAILRVLGFDTVLYLAIGLALGNSFKLDKKGPLGAKNIWQHAVYTAAICQKLSQKCPKEFRPSPGQAYLSGLLHDIGFLVLANSFETEYFWLNKLIAAKSDVPITIIEHQLLGIHHTDLGKILLQNWNMPEFLTVAVAEHHNENYLGKYCELSGLVLLVDRALKSINYSTDESTTNNNAILFKSDAFTDVLPQELVSRLGLTHELVFESVNEVLDCSDSLNSMISAMSA